MNNDMLTTPVLFLIFNRPDTTQVVFNEIRKARPAKLFIAADGPRIERPEELGKCRQTREIAAQVDWKCEVNTLFRDNNLGCREAVSSAINWFFESVKEGIVLEDDCLPDQSFFPFCEELLNRYRHDNRVMQINGSNYLTSWDKQRESYFFSKYGPVWGWASWKRAWNYYDARMTSWPEIKERHLYDFCDSKEEIAARKKIYDDVHSGKIDTWDYQWGLAKMINSGLSVTPCSNLVTNIGFSVNATHTTVGNKFANMNRFSLPFPLKHPAHVLRDRRFDAAYFASTMGERAGARMSFLVRKLVRKYLK